MYKKNTQPTAPTTSTYKKPNRNNQPLPLPDKKNDTNSDFKSKDEQLLQLVK